MNRKTQAPDAPIRLPLRHDAKPIRELARLAHPRMPDHMVNELGTVVHNGYMDGTRMAFQETANAAIIDNVPFLSSVRVIAPSEQGARSFVFCAPPMNWIVQQRRSGLTIADRVVLSGALTECNLIATQPRWQRRGYATRLLADAEDRYRTAGYRCMFAVLNDGGVRPGSGLVPEPRIHHRRPGHPAHDPVLGRPDARDRALRPSPGRPADGFQGPASRSVGHAPAQHRARARPAGKAGSLPVRTHRARNDKELTS